MKTRIKVNNDHCEKLIKKFKNTSQDTKMFEKQGNSVYHDLKPRDIERF